MDKKTYELVFDGKPVAKARPRFCRRGNYVGTYKLSDEQKLEDLYKCSALLQLKEQGLRTPIKKGVAVKLSMEFVFEFPKSCSKKKRTELIGRPHTIKPDFDNLEKFYKDTLNGILYEDDSQIARIGDSGKTWGEKAGTRITVEIL